MGCLFDYAQVIKHNYFIKTGEGPQAAVAGAAAQVGVIWYSLTTAIPFSIAHRNKSRGPSRYLWKRSTRKRTPLIKALLNLRVSVRYRRAITPELLLLFLLFSRIPSPSYPLITMFSLFFFNSSSSPPNTSPPFVFSRFCVWKKPPLHTPFTLLIAAHDDFLWYE